MDISVYKVRGVKVQIIHTGKQETHLPEDLFGSRILGPVGPEAQKNCRTKRCGSHFSLNFLNYSRLEKCLMVRTI